MALLWSREVGGVRYEVRTAGRTRRLYTDGVFHSQFNPERPAGGSVWDLLMLPAFFLPPESVRRVLVLGVGGGAVIRLLQHFVGPESVVGVELNPVHLSVARRFFGVGGPGVALHRADAVQWMSQYRGEPFDLIIDDLFGGSGGVPVRAVGADPQWFRSLLRPLAPGGALVMNFADTEELGRAWYGSAAVRRRFEAGFRLSTAQNENAVGVFLRRAADSGTLRRRLAGVAGLDPARRSTRLCYRIRRLQP
jgi:spermidine synthase